MVVVLLQVMNQLAISVSCLLSGQVQVLLMMEKLIIEVSVVLISRIMVLDR